MSDKLYQEAYEKFNDKQKDTMYDLYMTGINHDGHSWVTYGDVERSVAIVTEEAYQQGYNDAIEEIRESITNNGAYQMNPQITEYDKGSDDAFEIVLNILEQLKGAEE